MADSDNSRTLPAVTLQEFHSLVSACVPDFSRPTILGADQPSDLIDEPITALWSRWSSAWDDALEAHGRQRELDARLLSTVSSIDSSSETGSLADPVYQHNKALEAEDHAFNAEGVLAERLFRERASSLSDVIAKLHVVLVKGQPSRTHPEFPWPQITAVLSDLLILDATASSICRASDQARDRQGVQARIAG